MTIKHVVVWKLKAEDEAQKRADGRKIVEVLGGLVGVVPELKSLEGGPNVAPLDRNWDVAIVAEFDDLDGMMAYQVHPEHETRAAVVREFAQQVTGVDYEV